MRYSKQLSEYQLIKMAIEILVLLFAVDNNHVYYIFSYYFYE